MSDVFRLPYIDTESIDPSSDSAQATSTEFSSSGYVSTTPSVQRHPISSATNNQVPSPSTGAYVPTPGTSSSQPTTVPVPEIYESDSSSMHLPHPTTLSTSAPSRLHASTHASRPHEVVTTDIIATVSVPMPSEIPQTLLTTSPLIGASYSESADSRVGDSEFLTTQPPNDSVAPTSDVSTSDQSADATAAVSSSGQSTSSANGSSSTQTPEGAGVSTGPPRGTIGGTRSGQLFVNKS